MAGSMTGYEEAYIIGTLMAPRPPPLISLGLCTAYDIPHISLGLCTANDIPHISLGLCTANDIIPPHTYRWECGGADTAAFC